MKKMWKRQEFQEEKENTVCEEIKRVKKNEITKQKRNVTITGRNVQLWNKFTALILLHWINGWIGRTVSGSSSGSRPPWTWLALSWQREISRARERCTGHSAVTLIWPQLRWRGTGSQGSCSRRDNIWCPAGGCSNCIGGKDVETVSLVAAEGLKATVAWPVLESVVIERPPGLLAAQDHPHS